MRVRKRLLPGGHRLEVDYRDSAGVRRVRQFPPNAGLTPSITRDAGGGAYDGAVEHVERPTVWCRCACSHASPSRTGLLLHPQPRPAAVKHLDVALFIDRSTRALSSDRSRA
jgi:hypothetical protein